jgi:hypothetical protein
VTAAPVWRRDPDSLQDPGRRGTIRAVVRKQTQPERDIGLSKAVPAATISLHLFMRRAYIVIFAMYDFDGTGAHIRSSSRPLPSEEIRIAEAGRRTE